MAQHAQGQHIIWQQFLIKEQSTFRVRPCQRETLANIRCMAFKKVIRAQAPLGAIYCGFVAAGAAALGLGAAVFAGAAAAAAAPAIVACLMTSSLGYLLSR